MDIQIIVVCAESFNTIMYSGKETETKNYLYKYGNHFDVINSMKALLGSCYSSYVALQLFIEFWPSQPTLSIFLYLEQESSSLVHLTFVYLF